MESRAAREATWQALERDLARERGLVARLRALRTRTRVALVVLAALVPTAAMALRHRTPLTLAHGALAACIVAVTATLTASLSRPQRPWARTALGALAALLPLASALAGGELSAPAHDHDPSAGTCFGLGAAYTAPALLLASLVARMPLRTATEVALLAGLCGISASLLLDVHCQSRQLVHLLLGHASVGIAWGLAYQAAAIGSRSSSARSNISTISRMS